MLSFEQKKSIFRSFQELHEKRISNNRLNYIYPDSLQRGKILSTQLQPNGNGYINGKYMDEEVIRTKGYIVDPRGWINIKDFSAEDLHDIIKMAMKSMSSKPLENRVPIIPGEESESVLKQELIETKSNTTLGELVENYSNNLFNFGFIREPIWVKENRTEISKLQTKTIEQSMELMQNVTNIWMSAMFGKIDSKK